MEYRIATQVDVPQLADMRWDFQIEDGAALPLPDKAAFLRHCTAFLQQGFERGDWTYWVADHQGELVAQIFVCTIRPVPRPGRLDDRYGYMTNVYTRPAYRNRGIGTALLRQVTRWAAEHDFAFLIVSPSERSVPFYQRAGFTAETEFLELRLRDA